MARIETFDARGRAALATATATATPAGPDRRALIRRACSDDAAPTPEQLLDIAARHLSRSLPEKPMKALMTAWLFIAPALAHADTKLAKGAAWDCKKDPNVSITTGGGKYTFKGPCSTINLGAGKNTLDIESVETLNINAGSCTITAASVDTVNLNGAKNTIALGTVGTIDFTGANNNVTWKKARTGDKPTFKGQPDKNTVSQGH